MDYSQNYCGLGAYLFYIIKKITSENRSVALKCNIHSYKLLNSVIKLAILTEKWQKMTDKQQLRCLLKLVCSGQCSHVSINYAAQTQAALMRDNLLNTLQQWHNGI